MAYLKPQAPLQKGDDYIYPITTADQVIATDGTHRLNNELDEIREETAVIESSSTSSHAYAVGKFLTYNGILYRVTSAIAVGDTLTPGTNITATNVGDQIKSLNDSLTNGLFKLKSYSFSYNISAGAEFNTSFVPTETGYYALGIVRFSTNNAHVLPVALNLGSNSYSIMLHNVGTSAKTGSLQVIVLFYKGTVTWIT